MKCKRLPIETVDIAKQKSRALAMVWRPNVMGKSRMGEDLDVK